MKMSEKQYNHAFTMSFSVSGSKYEDWYIALQQEPHLVWGAIQDRLLHGMDDVLESCEGYDTYLEGDEEDEFFGFTITE
jgi:hypothetical protein